MQRLHAIVIHNNGPDDYFVKMNHFPYLAGSHLIAVSVVSQTFNKICFTIMH